MALFGEIKASLWTGLSGEGLFRRSGGFGSTSLRGENEEVAEAVGIRH